MEQLASDLPHRPIGRERDTQHATVTVLRDRLVSVEVERHHKRARAVGGGQRGGLPAARGQPQRGVLELGLGRSERRRELPEHLGVGVKRVAGVLPRRVGKRGPGGGHGSKVQRPSTGRRSASPALLNGIGNTIIT